MRPTTVAVLVALAALAVAIVALVRSGEDGGLEAQRLELTAIRDDFHYNDVPPDLEDNPNYSAADYYVFSAKLIGDREGRLEGHCVATQTDEQLCEVTYVLEDGTIAADGTAESDRDDYALAVVGGTDAYEGARGTAARRIEGKSRISHVLTLLLPTD